MSVASNALYGTTSKSGSVPSARDGLGHANGGPAQAADGPVFADDGRMLLCDSFADLRPIPNMAWFEAGLQAMLASDDFVERWRIWDCYAQGWANIDLTMYRFETFDLVVHRQANLVCSWRGAIDTQTRILASHDPGENDQKCWQWLRVPTL